MYKIIARIKRFVHCQVQGALRPDESHLHITGFSFSRSKKRRLSEVACSCSKVFLSLLVIGIATTWVRAQQTIIVPSCVGTASLDTAKFTAIQTAVGSSNLATIRLPYKTNPSQRCKVNNLSLTANITLDNSDGSGIAVTTGQTLTIAGEVVNPKTRQIFYNALSGQGTVVFADNSSPELWPDAWGASPRDSTDDLAAIRAAVASAPSTGSGLHFNRGTYRVSGATTLKSNMTVTGERGSTINAVAISSGLDVFAIVGSNSAGAEGHNITISGLALINNTHQYEISIVGYTYTNVPHDIRIKDIVTSGSSLTGAIWLNQAYNVWFEYCDNVGGVEHMGIVASDGATPEGANPNRTHHIYVDHCTSTGTTQYGYQFVNAQDCYISHTVSDGAAEVAGDEAGITFDRVVGGEISFNYCKNSPIVNIFVTGCDGIVVAGNQAQGGGSGIIIAHNNETALAPSINESYRIKVSLNTVSGYSPILNGILVSGVRDSSFFQNTVASVGGADVNLLVVDAIRNIDAHPELSQNNVFVGNICGGNMQFSSAAAQNVGLNQGTYTGSSFKLMVANGVAGGIDFGSSTRIYRDENNGDFTFSGGAVKLVNSFKLSNAVSMSRGGVLTAVWSPSAVNANDCGAQSVTVTGVATGDIVVVSKPTHQAGLLIGGVGIATGTNTVSVNFCNLTASPITPTASQTYSFSIVK